MLAARRPRRGDNKSYVEVDRPAARPRAAPVRLRRTRTWVVGSPLVGTWRLARVQMYSASGRSSSALFPAATGTLTYRPDGRMTVRISDGQSERPHLAFDGTYLSYLDPFVPTGDYVVHRIESGADAD